MIGFSELCIILAVLGAGMLIASIFWKEYSASLKSVGVIFLVLGIVLYFALLLLG